jgi:hypothetical protein
MSSRLRQALEGLHAERSLAPGLGLGEIRHVGLHHARGNGVDPDAAGAQRGGEVLHQGVDGALGRGISRQGAGRSAGDERGREDDRAALAQHRQQLLHQEVRRADVDGKQPVEVLERGVLDAGRLGDAGVGDEDVEAVADDGADLPGQRVRTFGLAPSFSALPPALRITATTAPASFSLLP